MNVCTRRTGQRLFKNAFRNTSTVNKELHFKPLPSSIESTRSESRRFKWEDPGTNLKNVVTYIGGEYPGWNSRFLPHLDINRYQRHAMFLKECEAAMFALNPLDYDPRELGFTEFSREPIIINKAIKQKPTHFAVYHDLCEMWKRRQYINLPFVNVGSFVEVTLRSKYDFARNVTYRGLVTERKHQDLSAHFVIRQNVSDGHSVENYIMMYSPWLESVQVLSFQVRNDKRGDMASLRDLSYEQSDIPETFPDPVIDPISKLEIPHYVPLKMDFRTDTRQQRRNQHSKHLLDNPRRDSLRNYKLWETDPELRYPRPTIKKKQITK